MKLLADTEYTAVVNGREVTIWIDPEDETLVIEPRRQHRTALTAMPTRSGAGYVLRPEVRK